MSNFDPSSPDYLPPGATLAYDGKTFGYREANQTAVAILSGTISASTATAVENFFCRGGLFVLNITSLPASASTTVALKLMTTNPATATFATLAARSAVGAVMLTVYPGVAESAGMRSAPLPRNFTARLSLSTGATSKEVALSLTMMRIT